MYVYVADQLFQFVEEFCLECISHFLLQYEAHPLPGVPVKKPTDEHSGDETLAKSSQFTPTTHGTFHSYMQEVELGSNAPQLYCIIQDTTRSY